MLPNNKIMQFFKNRLKKFFKIKSKHVKNNQEKEKSLSDDQLPTIGLINGLSGGHKGRKVMNILNEMEIPCFDLLHLSQDETYFNEFVSELARILKSLIL